MPQGSSRYLIQAAGSKAEIVYCKSASQLRNNPLDTRGRIWREDLPYLRDRIMCLRATGQLVVIQTVQLGLKHDMVIKDIIDELNKLSWEMDNPLWNNLIVVDGRINSSTRAITLTSNFIAYYIGIPQSAHDLRILREEYRNAKGPSEGILPKPLWFETH